ncbi:phosphoinositide phosphatase SAC8 isoform X1 [Tanacetum coccineum]
MKSMVVKRHFHDLLERYKNTIYVDLNDKHGNEGLLNLAYATEMEKLPGVRVYLQNGENGSLVDVKPRIGDESKDKLRIRKQTELKNQLTIILSPILS